MHFSMKRRTRCSRRRHSPCRRQGPLWRPARGTLDYYFTLRTSSPDPVRRARADAHAARDQTTGALSGHRSRSHRTSPIVAGSVKVKFGTERRSTRKRPLTDRQPQRVGLARFRGRAASSTSATTSRRTTRHLARAAPRGAEYQHYQFHVGRSRPSRIWAEPALALLPASRTHSIR